MAEHNSTTVFITCINLWKPSNNQLTSMLSDSHSIPLPTVFSFSAIDQVISDRYILMDLLPGVDLASLLDAISLSLRQRLEMAERVAELIADIHAIAIPGGEGLIGGHLCRGRRRGRRR